MADIKLDFVNSYTDSRGKRRHQFRRKGFKRPTIKGRPGSAEFMEHYHALVEQTGKVVAEAGASRIKAGTIDAWTVKYLAHESFTDLSEEMRKTRRPILEKFRNHLTEVGRRRYGDLHFVTMKPKHVDAFLDGCGWSVRDNRVKAVRGLSKYAKDQGAMDADPTAHIKLLKKSKSAKSTGFMTWKPPQVEQYRARHPVGTMARVAIELLLNIAARRTDAYQIGRPHMAFNAEIEANVLTWRPQKTSKSTGRVLSIPVLPALQRALDAMKAKATTALTFLVDERTGRPFVSADALGREFARWCNEAGLPTVLCADGKWRNYRQHGLRKAALYNLYKAGGTPAELQALGGHGTLAELDKYIREVEQDEMAISAMVRVATAPPVQIRNEAVTNAFKVV